MSNPFFNSLIRSCFDFRFYKDIFNQAIGRTMRYLLFLSLFVTVVIGLRYAPGLARFVREGALWLEKNAPNIEIADGTVKADVEQPYIKEEKEFVVIIDTTDKIKEIDAKYKTGVLLTKDKLIIKSSEERSQIFELKKVKSFKLNKDTINNMKRFFIFLLIPFIVVFQLFYFFIAKIIQSAVAGLLVVIARPGIKFINAFNLCIYAVTPATLLAVLVMFVMPRPAPVFSLVYVGMYIAFIIGAIGQCIKEPEAK